MIMYPYYSQSKPSIATAASATTDAITEITVPTKFDAAPSRKVNLACFQTMTLQPCERKTHSFTTAFRKKYDMPSFEVKV
jgi:hypothetical protein